MRFNKKLFIKPKARREKREWHMPKLPWWFPMFLGWLVYGLGLELTLYLMVNNHLVGDFWGINLGVFDGVIWIPLVWWTIESRTNHNTRSRY